MHCAPSRLTRAADCLTSSSPLPSKHALTLAPQIALCDARAAHHLQYVRLWASVGPNLCRYGAACLLEPSDPASSMREDDSVHEVQCRGQKWKQAGHYPLPFPSRSAGLAVVWWVVASLVLSGHGGEANKAGLPQKSWRNAVIILCWATACLFGLLFLLHAVCGGRSVRSVRSAACARACVACAACAPLPLPQPRRCLPQPSAYLCLALPCFFLRPPFAPPLPHTGPRGHPHVQLLRPQEGTAGLRCGEGAGQLLGGGGGA